jgi:hypothetical protein
VVSSSTFQLWQRVAVFTALARGGWRALPPSLDARYDIGEQHRFARGDEELVLRVRPTPERGVEAIATNGEATHRLALEPKESRSFRLALHAWARALAARTGAH